MSEDSSNLDLSRRKILGGMVTVGAASAAAGAGTMALFSDTESSTGNTIQAGTLDLTPDSPASIIGTVSNKAPGDSGSETLSLTNSGSLSGGLSVEVNITNYGQGDNPESQPTYDQSGELRDELSVEIGFDDGGKEPVLSDASIGTNALEGERDALKRLSSGGSTDLYVDWAIGEDATNEIQGDELTFEIVVRLFQEEPIVVDPASGNGDYSTIQGAVDASSAGQTIQVNGGTYSEAVTIDTDGLQVLGAGSGSVTVDASGASVGIEVVGNDVTLSGMTVEDAIQAVDVNGQNTSSGRATGVSLTDLTIGSSVSDRGLVVDNTDEAVVKNVTSNDNGNDGLTFWYTNDSRMENVTANNNADNGIYFNGDNNTLINAEARNNADEGVDINWYDDRSRTEQRVTVDTVIAANNNGGEDIELHDNGTDQSAATDSKLLKNVETSGADIGLRYSQVAESEVERVRCSFPNGIDTDGDGTDDGAG